MMLSSLYVCVYISYIRVFCRKTCMWIMMQVYIYFKIKINFIVSTVVNLQHFYHDTLYSFLNEQAELLVKILNGPNLYYTSPDFAQIWFESWDDQQCKTRSWFFVLVCYALLASREGIRLVLLTCYNLYNIYLNCFILFYSSSFYSIFLLPTDFYTHLWRQSILHQFGAILSVMSTRNLRDITNQ